MKPSEETFETLLKTRFLNMYDWKFMEGRHYYIVSRREPEDMALQMDEASFSDLNPDAVTLCVILQKDGKDYLLLFYEFRYPTGHFLLSPPAGLIDPADRKYPDAVKRTSIRELYEETGLPFDESKDLFRIVNPCLFSSPGMTDETNAIALFVIRNADESLLTDSHSEVTEQFDGFVLLDREMALSCLAEGKDRKKNPYSVYTSFALLYFVSGLWKEDAEERG